MLLFLCILWPFMFGFELCKQSEMCTLILFRRTAKQRQWSLYEHCLISLRYTSFDIIKIYKLDFDWTICYDTMKELNTFGCFIFIYQPFHRIPSRFLYPSSNPKKMILGHLPYEGIFGLSSIQGHICFRLLYTLLGPISISLIF